MSLNSCKFKKILDNSRSLESRTFTHSRVQIHAKSQKSCSKMTDVHFNLNVLMFLEVRKAIVRAKSLAAHGIESDKPEECWGT